MDMEPVPIPTTHLEGSANQLNVEMGSQEVIHTWQLTTCAMTREYARAWGCPWVRLLEQIIIRIVLLFLLLLLRRRMPDTLPVSQYHFCCKQETVGNCSGLGPHGIYLSPSAYARLSLFLSFSLFPPLS